jgi:hypothetical protein
MRRIWDCNGENRAGRACAMPGRSIRIMEEDAMAIDRGAAAIVS